MSKCDSCVREKRTLCFCWEMLGTDSCGVVCRQGRKFRGVDCKITAEDGHAATQFEANAGPDVERSNPPSSWRRRALGAVDIWDTLSHALFLSDGTKRQVSGAD